MTDVLFPLAGKRIWVAGHRGMVGSAICRRLADAGCELITVGREDVDLRDQAATDAWIAATKPDAIFFAAARVGGIHANNSRPATFIYDNLIIEANIINSAWKAGVGKLLFLGSSCIYPKDAAQPMAEDALLSGPLEPTNEWYAIAKIAGIKMCLAYRKQYGCDFISAQPTNLYGYGDNFDLETSHVLPALMAKAHQAKVAGAKTMEIWGSGRPLREFMFVDDLADALVFLMENYSNDQHINVGSGQEFTIREAAEIMADVVGFKGELTFNADRPDGMKRKFLDTSRLNALGWKAKTDLRTGLEKTYDWYLRNVVDGKP